MKRNYLLILSLLSSLVVTGCKDKNIIELNEIDDNYRTMYQIVPISYADSNGDGKGDLQGIIDKLDYIDSLNYTSIWMTPVHPSNSYHKYDVKDYKDIDKTFGTLDDYDNLVTKAHEKGINIILDLVINHTSNVHPWFLASCEAHKRGKTTDQYYNYYNFINVANPSSVPQGYTIVPGSNTIAYESRFGGNMPDLNLDSVLNGVNSYLGKDLKDIIKFWLVDHDIDGFRLDATTSYFTGSVENNKKMLTWINDTAKSFKSDCYIVAEASWDSNSSENLIYQESGIDSCFQFGNANASGYIGATVKQQMPKILCNGIIKNKDNAGNGIPAPFVCNHDTGRLVGSVAGRTSIGNAKFGHGLLAIMGGTTTSYYGDEIGMAVSQSGLNNDPNKRLHMNWGDSYDCNDPSGTIAYSKEESYPYPNVKEQQKDKNSILNYVANANLLRKQFPELARGDAKLIYENLTSSLIVMERTYNGSSIYVAINASISSDISFTLDDIKNKDVKLVTSLLVDGKCSEKNGKITVPAQGIAILR